MPIIKIHNIETGEITEREMSKEELAQREADLQLLADEAALLLGAN